MIAAFAEKSDARHASSSPATSRSRTKGSEVKVQQGDSLASKSLTLSTMVGAQYINMYNVLYRYLVI